MEKRHATSARRSRRFFVLVILLAALAAFLWWGNNDLMVERFTISSGRLPDGFDGFRIVQLSDLHEKEFGEDNAALLAAVAEEDPNLIAITGDMIDRFKGENPEYVDTVCRALAEIAPTYYVTGNHEWAVGNVPALKQQLTGLGVTVLSNEFAVLERNGDTIVLAGIDDPNGYADQKSPEQVATDVRSAFGDPFWILLAHRNDHFETQYSRLGADLVLSGHGHGGIIRLPFTDGLLSTDRTFFPSYTAGLYELNGTQLLVSRGVGNSGPLPRLFNRPEIAVLTLLQETTETR